MRFKISISGTEVLLTSEQLELVANALYGAERMTSKYVKDDKGNASYIPVLSDDNANPWFSPAVVTDEAYNALKFMTEMQKGK